MYSLNFDIYNKQYNFNCVSNIRNISINEISCIIIKYSNSLKIDLYAFNNRHKKNGCYNTYNSPDDTTIIKNLFV
jgi:hypothetical protein